MDLIKKRKTIDYLHNIYENRKRANRIQDMLQYTSNEQLHTMFLI